MAFENTTSFWQSFATQRRVVHALLLREVITRYGRHNFGVLWLVVEPMLFTLGVSAAWTWTKLHTVSGIPIVAFAITGYSSILLWRNISNHCVKAVEPNLALMFHRNVKVVDVLISRILIEVIGASSSFIILTIFFASLTSMPWPRNLLTLLMGWFLLCWFSLALGLLVGALSERSEFLERTWHIFLYLIIPISGAVYMVDWLPPRMQAVVLWIPMVHGTEMIRHGYFGSIIPTYESPLYFSVFNLILTFAGLVAVKDCQRRIQPQ